MMPLPRTGGGRVLEEVRAGGGGGEGGSRSGAGPGVGPAVGDQMTSRARRLHLRTSGT